MRNRSTLTGMVTLRIGSGRKDGSFVLASVNWSGNPLQQRYGGRFLERFRKSGLSQARVCRGSIDSLAVAISIAEP